MTSNQEFALKLLAIPLIALIWILAIPLTIVWWCTILGLIADCMRTVDDNEPPAVLRVALDATRALWT